MSWKQSVELSRETPANTNIHIIISLPMVIIVINIFRFHFPIRVVIYLPPFFLLQDLSISCLLASSCSFSISFHITSGTTPFQSRRDIRSYRANYIHTTLIPSSFDDEDNDDDDDDDDDNYDDAMIVLITSSCDTYSILHSFYLPLRFIPSLIALSAACASISLLG